ncbi:MAG: MFS transporter [Thermoplasmata archaeon]|nr:MFS transporter [Thermoplasmata archaeon]
MAAAPDPAVAPAPSRSPLRVLRNRSFARLYFAGATSIGGFSIGQIALSWLVFQRTGSSVAIAFLGVAFLLASVLLSLVGGTLVDRQDRRRLMVLADVVRAASLAVLVLVLLAVGFRFEIVLAVSFLLGAGTTIFQPAERALTPELVDAGELADANGLVGTSNSVLGFLGNAAGGLLVGALGIAVALGVNALTFVVSAILLMSIRVAGTSVAASAAVRRKRTTTFSADTRDGFRYIASQRGLLYLTVSAGSENFFFSIMAPFLVVYTTVVLHGNAVLFGVLGALLALGWAPGSLLVGRLGAVRYAGMIWILCGIAEGALILVFVFVPVLPVVAAALLAQGVLLGFSNTTWLTAVQQIVPTEMQGRYFGVDQLGSFATIPAGMLVGGVLIQAVGIGATYTVAGVGFAVTAALFLASGELRRLRVGPPSPGPDLPDAAPRSVPSHGRQKEA